MSTLEWNPTDDPTRQLERWCERVVSPGCVRVVFRRAGSVGEIPWNVIERWTRSRAVTVAEIWTDLAPPALDVALCADLVHQHHDARLMTGDGNPSAGMLWALGRCGRPALARALLDESPLTASQAERLGLVHGVFSVDRPPLAMNQGSEVALTIARDLMRSTAGPGPKLQLELAAFRLLMASGEPREGARAFLDRRRPEFGSGHG